MTLSGKLEADLEIKAPAHLFHDVFRGRPHHLTTISPDKFHSSDLHEGEFGKEGAVIKFDYTHDGKKKYAKDIVEKIDDKNFSTTLKVVEGDLLNEYESFKFIIQAVPKGSGSLVYWTLEYEKIKEDTPDPHSMLEFCVHLSKDIDAHLIKAQS